MAIQRSQRTALWASVILYLIYKNPFNVVLSLRLIGVYYGLNLFAASVAYATSKPKLLGKRGDGTIPAWAYVLFGPWLLQSWLLVSLAIKLNHYRGVPRISTIRQSQLYLGAVPSPQEIARRNIACVVDATADLPRSVDVAPENYLCVPILDGDAPSVEQLDKAAEFICRQLREKKAVLVHCGYGIGRSTTLMCAALVKLGMFRTWPDAFSHIKSIRPTVALSEAYIRALQLWSLAR